MDAREKKVKYARPRVTSFLLLTGRVPLILLGLREQSEWSAQDLP